MTGFTGVVWDARTTEQLALDLGDGAGPAPLVEAGLAWADVAAELGSAGAEYGSILAALGVHWRSSYTSEAFEKLTRLVPWFAEAAAAAGRTAARAETQAAAVTVARMTMPNLAEVDLAEKAKDVATTVSALAPALVGAAAQAERALHDQRMRAARVMETYEAATEPAAQPWPGGPAAPNLVSATALGAERAARETAARAAARQATVTPPVAPGASMMGGVGPALAVPAPEKTRYAPTILAGAGPAATTAPVTAPSPGTGTPTGPVAPPMAPHGAATTERVIARGAGAAEPATDVEPSGAAAAADGPATWAELAVAEQPVAHHLSTGHGDRPLDQRYLDETLALDGRTGPDMWSVTAEPATVLGVPELLRLGELVGVQTWPVVLDLWRTHDDADQLAAVAAAADREIHGRGLMEGGEPSAWAAVALRVLSAPERQLEIRIVADPDADWDADGDGDGAAGDGPRARETVRICLARNGHDHVIARREGGQIGLRHLDVAAESELGAIVAREFLPADGATFGGFSAPADELAARLATCVSSNDVADALHALGATSSDAVALAAGLTSAHARSEIVAVSWTGGTSTQSSGALAIFDTDRGRIVASPSKSPDGRVWTTLSPGSGHRIGQAVGLLIETLPEGRWMP